MTPDEITSLFNEALNQRGLLGKLPGITKDHVYDWRHGRTTPTLGDMLSALYQLNLIIVTDGFTSE